MFDLKHFTTFTLAKLQKVILILVEMFPRITIFNTPLYAVNMSGSALVPWEVSSTQTPISDEPRYFTFACTIFCYFAAKRTVLFLPPRKFVSIL
jgi:hypothetical protein